MIRHVKPTDRSSPLKVASQTKSTIHKHAFGVMCLSRLISKNTKTLHYFVRGLHRSTMDSPHKRPVMRFHAMKSSWLCFYQTRLAWSVDQGSNKNHSPAYNFAPTVTKFCVMWEGLSLPHDTKFGNCRCKTVDSRAFPSWSLIHGLRWSGLIKAKPGIMIMIYMQEIKSVSPVMIPWHKASLDHYEETGC